MSMNTQGLSFSQQKEALRKYLPGYAEMEAASAQIKRPLYFDHLPAYRWSIAFLLYKQELEQKKIGVWYWN
jgi:hypothetical protein